LEEALGTDVLASVLDASDEVRQELVDGALVHHRPRHALGYLDLVTLTAT
jgi:hypothetical protein